MCGIAGGLFWGGRVSGPQAETAVRAMVDALRHRGPDGRGLFISPTGPLSTAAPFVVFGHTRLAILDVSDAGAQPMGGRDGESCITYNGEAYNFADLKSRLEALGARFTSKTDTEVILRGYDAWGVDVLAKLHGMFAFALWDPRAQRLLLARDRLGIKPLYVFGADGCVLFASEVRALLASGLVPRRLDATALWQYLGYQSVPAPRTLIAGVRSLGAGCWNFVDGSGQTTSGQYWHMLERPADGTAADPRDRRRELRRLLQDAVSSHLVSDVPVGAFLSGGIDSSAVVGLMREAGITPRTFSVGFKERAFDESTYAGRVAERFRTDHTHIRLTENDLLDHLPAALRSMDLPTGDGVNTHVISGAVRAQGIAVALSGLGGDEVFGGYPSFARLTRLADVSWIWGRSPDALRSAAAAAVRLLGRSSVPASKAAAVLETDGSLSAMFPLTRQVLSVGQRTALLDEALLGHVIDRTDPYEAVLAEAFAGAPASTLFGRISFAEARTYMHDVLLRDTDQMSMAHGLEVRVPLLDHRVVDYVMSVPDADKQSRDVPKALLVESLDGLLPADIVQRPKQGFTLPFDPWMRGALRPLCEERLGDRGLAGRGLFRATAIQELWQSFLAGGRDVSWSRLWILVVLDAWLDSNDVTL
jgi:asparagine synthase (glutamine-hydrolysing)